MALKEVKKGFLIIFFIFVGAAGYLTWHLRQLEERELQLGYKKYVSGQPGILIEIHDNLEFLNFPVASRVLEDKLDLTHENFPSIASVGISAEVKGFLRVKEEGEYSFELASDDGAILYLDGKLFLDNSGYHTFQSVKGKKYLAGGWRYFKIRYRNEAGAAALKLAWGREGEKRRTVKASEVNLPRDLPPTLEPFPGLLTLEQGQVAMARLGFLACAALLLILIFFEEKLNQLLREPQTWAAAAVFLLALALRWIYYAGHLELRIQGIMDGGDNNHFLLLPLRFESHGEWISMKCGNLPLLMPLLGTLYRWFGFFPGLDVYALLMLVLGAGVTILPWLLLRRTGAGWAGLAAGIFLAVNPTLVELKSPIVSSDPLGFFTFSLAIFFCLKALRTGGWAAHLLAGAALALLPLSRTAFIPLAPILAVGLVALSPRRLRALLGLALFAAIVVGYDLAARTLTEDSYFLYYLRDGMRATTFHRAAETPHEWWRLLVWLPRYGAQYGVLGFSTLLPGLSAPAEFARWGLAALLAAAAALTAWRYPRVFLFLLAAAGIYLWEVSSYHAHPRLLMPLVAALAFLLALGLSEVKPLRQGRISAVLILLFLGMGWGVGGMRAWEFWTKRSENNQFYKWVAKTAPPESILFTDDAIDPWQLHRRTALPVFFDVTKYQTLAAARPVMPTTRVTFVADQSQIPPLQNPPPPAPAFDHHRYVLDGLARQKFHFLVVQENFASQIENFYFKNKTQMAVNPRHYRLRKLSDYPADSKKGIWILERTTEPLERETDFIPPPVPPNLSRFLFPMN